MHTNTCQRSCCCCKQKGGLGSKKDGQNAVEAGGRHACLFRQHPDVLRVFWVHKKMSHEESMERTVIQIRREKKNHQNMGLVSCCRFVFSFSLIYAKKKKKYNQMQLWLFFPSRQNVASTLLQTSPGLVEHEYASLEADVFLPRVTDAAFNGARLKALLLRQHLFQKETRLLNKEQEVRTVVMHSAAQQQFFCSFFVELTYQGCRGGRMCPYKEL